jgi:hypothetical protein
MKPIPYNNRNKGWRRQGFGLFMLKCMIKSVYARLPSVQALDVYLQCYEPQSYNCYAKLGFVQINTAFVDGFELLPDHLQKSLLSPPSESRKPGECLFHFLSTDQIEKKPYQLMLLRSGCLRHFVEEPDSDIPSKGVEWCRYPPPYKLNERLVFPEATVKKWICGLPLIKALLPPPYDFGVPVSALQVKGEMMLAYRLMHTEQKGKKWLATGEIDLMIATLLWDGRYNDVSFVFTCTNLQTIESAFEHYRNYTNAKSLFDEANKKDLDLNKVQAAIVEKYGSPVHELGATYQKEREHILKKLVTPNAGILSRRVLVFPFNECDGHWAVTFVFNPSYINSSGSSDTKSDSNLMRPCFFRYCS